MCLSIASSSSIGTIGAKSQSVINLYDFELVGRAPHHTTQERGIGSETSVMSFTWYNISTILNYR
jgi:hypothetical protein